MLENGVRNFKTKMNSLLYFVLYFFGLLFPVYYFLELLLDRKKKLLEERDRKVDKSRTKTNNFKMTYKIDMLKMKNNDPEYGSNSGLVSQYNYNPILIQEKKNRSKKNHNAITPISNHHISKPR